MFDDNGDGKIDMKELVEGLELLTNGTETDKLTFLFRVYDLDGKKHMLLFLNDLIRIFECLHLYFWMFVIHKMSGNQKIIKLLIVNT